MEEIRKKYPKGHYISLGVAMGLPLGIPLWLVTENPGMMGAGVAIGIAIGMAFEGKYNRDPRPLTPEEVRNRKIAVAAGVLALMAGVVVFFYIMLA
jgi:hypothetical protein